MLIVNIGFLIVAVYEWIKKFKTGSVEVTNAECSLPHSTTVTTTTNERTLKVPPASKRITTKV